MKRLLVATALLLLACPRRASTTVAGTDDELMDQYAAKLEELRTAVTAKEPSCAAWRTHATEVCDLSKNVCEVAKRNADRSDFEKRCVGSQEDCARFNDSASSCRG